MNNTNRSTDKTDGPVMLWATLFLLFSALFGYLVSRTGQYWLLLVYLGALGVMGAVAVIKVCCRVIRALKAGAGK